MLKMSLVFKNIFRILFITFIAYYTCLGSANAKLIHTTYNVEFIKNIELEGGELLKLERAFARPSKKVKTLHTRIQISNKSGDVVAFTPTRITAIPFCFSLNECWVFMWKSVYPLPAIFKFNVDRSDWIKEKKPPMIYSRAGYAGEGFEERINPFFGIFGLILFILHNFVFFSVLIVISMIMFFQIAKYHGLSMAKKKWVRKLLFIANFIIPFVIFPTNPYVLTGCLICVLSIVGILIFSIPLVLTVLLAIATFTLLACSQKEKVKKRI